MQCQIQTVDHSKCAERMACLADPCAVLPDHAAAVTTTQCPNEAAEGTDVCQKHLRFVNKINCGVEQPGSSSAS